MRLLILSLTGCLFVGGVFVGGFAGRRGFCAISVASVHFLACSIHLSICLYADSVSLFFW
jgi:hypothetical protein